MAAQLIVGAADATHENISHLPAGLVAAGYTTGSLLIKWTAKDWAEHAGAVRICQDSAASDETADVLDVERYAATPGECPRWARQAAANYALAKRPGQRHPAIYTSANNVTPVVNALVAGGVTSGVNLWVANWNLTQAEAIAQVLAAAGPFPVIGIQFTDKPVYYDLDVFAAYWLADVSGQAKQPFYRHVADGTRSLHQVCEDRHTTVEHLVSISMRHLASAETAALVGYLAAGSWTLLRHSGAAARMPKGLVYATTNP